jgi:hypothetical protein
MPVHAKCRQHDCTDGHQQMVGGIRTAKILTASVVMRSLQDIFVLSNIKCLLSRGLVATTRGLQPMLGSEDGEKLSRRWRNFEACEACRSLLTGKLEVVTYSG